MCGYKPELRAAGAGSPAESETVRLSDHPHAEGRHCGFPWWTLWLLWPLFWVGKGATHLAAGAVAWLGQPLAFTITPLPFLLIGAGLIILAIGALRRRHD